MSDMRNFWREQARQLTNRDVVAGARALVTNTRALVTDRSVALSAPSYRRSEPNPADRHDVFDEKGRFLRYTEDISGYVLLTQQTDSVLIQRADGMLRNVTGFDYSIENTANRAMLSNVMTYYARKVKINQQIGIRNIDESVEPAAFAVTVKNRTDGTLRVYFAVVNGRINPSANTRNNIMNAFVHETVHLRGDFSELNAIKAQTAHSTWMKTTQSFRMATVRYAVENIMKKITATPDSCKLELDTIVGAINRNIRASGLEILFDGEEAFISTVLQDVIVRPQR